MDFQIREMYSEDTDAKGYVHWKTWQETYIGLMDEKYLTSQTLEKCQSIARRWPENTLVAELDGKIVGFSCYGKDASGIGEIFAIYLLKEVQGSGLGRKLMDATLHQLSDCPLVFLWVLEGNTQAIGFYKHYGFRMDGNKQDIPQGRELRMIYNRC